jgi:hypothetical protein
LVLANAMLTFSGWVMFVHAVGGNFVPLAGGNVCCLLGDGNCEWKTREEEAEDSSPVHFHRVATVYPTFPRKRGYVRLRAVHTCSSDYSMPCETVQDQTDELLREEYITAAKPNAR